MKDSAPDELNRYYLQVLETGESPKWPRPEEELVIGSQDLGDGYTQYWAYHPESGKTAEDLPPAEVVASENTTPKPAILVDQPRPIVSNEADDVLDLILVKDGHAYGYQTSSVDGLEDNLSELIGLSEDKFKFDVEHFLTTSRVTEEVEKRLDSLEDSEQETVDSEQVNENQENEEDEEELKVNQHSDEPEISDPVEEEVEERQETVRQEMTDDQTEDTQSSDSLRSENLKSHVSDLSDLSNDDPEPPIRRVQTGQHLPTSGIYTASQIRPGMGSSSRSNNKWMVIIPLTALGLVAAGVFVFKDSLFSAVSNTNSTAIDNGRLNLTPTEAAPSPTPTLAPVERSEYKIRVLNGTTTSGLASDLSDKLKEVGWEIDRVGNNKNQEVEKGYIRFKEGTEESVIKRLILDLDNKYEASTEADLAESDKADLEVVIGKEN